MLGKNRQGSPRCIGVKEGTVSETDEGEATNEATTKSEINKAGSLPVTASLSKALAVCGRFPFFDELRRALDVGFAEWGGSSMD